MAGKSSPRQKEPTLADLKRQVLGLAGVSSTRELKRTNVDLHHLDFRLKASWRSALEVLQQAAAAMDHWESNPPEDYRELSPRSIRQLRPTAPRLIRASSSVPSCARPPTTWKPFPVSCRRRPRS